VGVAATAAVVVANGASGGSSAGTITTIAGGGKPSSAEIGDGGPATSASLSEPWGVAVDPKGNVFIADSQNNRVRKVTPGGKITTFAGTGKCCFGGDGGPATMARLFGPAGVATDVHGNVFIADFGNNRVRKVSSRGTITTIAGRGDGVFPGRGSGFSGDGGPAKSALLDDPYGVAVDPKGNVFIADTGNDRVRKVSRSGTITTIAGGGKPPSADIGDGGPATSASLDRPYGVAVDAKGQVFIADRRLIRVRKVSRSGTITTIADPTLLLEPTGVATDRTGNVYVVDAGLEQVFRIGADGKITRIAGAGGIASPARNGDGNGDGGPATSALFQTPEGVAVDVKGNVYIADTYASRVRKVWSGGGGTPTPAKPGPTLPKGPAWPKPPDAWVPLASVSNGCGGGKTSTDPQWLDEWIFRNATLTKKYSVNFRDACNLHDAGYSGAKVNDPLNGGRVIDYFTWTREAVDAKLLADMRRTCDRAIPMEEGTALRKCKITAQGFYDAVRDRGSKYWNDRPHLRGRWAAPATLGISPWSIRQDGRLVTATWSGDLAHPNLHGEFQGTVISRDGNSTIEGFFIVTKNGVANAPQKMKLVWNPKTPSSLKVSTGFTLTRL